MKGARWALGAALLLAACGGDDSSGSSGGLADESGFNAAAVMELLHENFRGQSDADLMDELDVWRAACTDELTREREIALRMTISGALGAKYIIAGCPERYLALAD